MSDSSQLAIKPTLRRFIIGPILATIALLVWGGVFWGVL